LAPMATTKGDITFGLLSASLSTILRCGRKVLPDHKNLQA